MPYPHEDDGKTLYEASIYWRNQGNSDPFPVITRDALAQLERDVRDARYAHLHSWGIIYGTAIGIVVVYIITIIFN